METIIKIIALHKGSTASLENIIYKVEYYLTLIENGGTRTESMILSLNDAEASSFVQYNDLTEDNIKTWITSHSQFNNQVDAIRQMKFNESMARVENNFPWES
tara:strand:+ start:1404 stop:1712 length:309 start_codon:yes stop_codon:yes gene_type:complete